MHTTLAQLSDIMSQSTWNVLLICGACFPLIGLIAAALMRSYRPWKGTSVGMFYFCTIPFAAMMFGSESGVFACLFVISMPIGILLDLIVLLPNSRPGKLRIEARGFDDRHPRRVR